MAIFCFIAESRNPLNPINQIDETNQINEINQMNQINQISLAIPPVLCKNKNNLHFYDLDGIRFPDRWLNGGLGLEVRPEI